MKNRIKFIIPFILIVALFGCSKDKSNNPSGPNNNGSWKVVASVNGVGADSTLSGSATFTVTNDSLVSGVFRVITPVAATHSLSGYYISITKVLAASGDGYVFSGYLNDTTGFRGSLTGAATGLVLGARDDDNTSIAYCGTFTGSDDGTFNFTVEGTFVHGSHTTSDGSAEELTGTITGNAITLYHDGAQQATGIRNGDNVSGTWNDNHGSSGTWSGSRCN